MNNKLLLITSFLTLTIFLNNTNAQSNFKAVYNHVDTENYDDNNHTLYYKNGLSKYVYSRKKEIIKVDNYEYKFPFAYFESYYNINKNKYYQYRILTDEKTPVVAEWENKVNWKILDKTKKIGKYTVQKATSDYLEKYFPGYGNVIVWFTMDIPIGIGPIRCVGLPGLVIKVEYENHRTKTIELKSIKFEGQEDIIINKDGIEVSKEDMLKPFAINKRWLRKKKKEYFKNKN